MSTDTDQQSFLWRGLTQQLESLQRAGVTHLPRPTATMTVADSDDEADTQMAKKKPATVTASAESSDGESYGDPLASTKRPAALRVIAKEVVGCTRCSELVSNRTQTVFGVGNPDARLCFLGEAPGADEDRQGEPFVGAAGQLLNKMIENGMGVERFDVYILNICKCRPPGNRAPTAEEAENCREFLDRQLAIIQPEYICCLGLTAAQSLLDTTQSLSRMRGRFFSHRSSKVICTYHPAYLLRNPSAKAQVWEDLKILMRDMGLPLPDKQ